MARLIYAAITSLDGYVADATGSFDWSAPDDEVHAAVNDVLRPAGTHLYGRRMYEVLLAWETIDTGPAQPGVIRDFAQLWRAADKVVYSGTLEAAGSTRTRIERQFDPVAVAQLKQAAERDLTIGGPTLAARAFRAGLVDECHLFLNPIAVGGGTPALPRNTRLPLRLLGERRFANGVVHLHYQPCRGDLEE
jgi:dihydrofolate reductase